MSIFSKIFDFSGREIKKYQERVEEIKKIAESYKTLGKNDLTAKTDEFKKRLKEGEDLNAMTNEAFAVVKEVARRFTEQELKYKVRDEEIIWKEDFFDVQIIGALVLWDGKIAQLKTGEGKTLVKTMPLYLAALEEKGSFLVTVNDYLSIRDAEWHLPLFKFLGLKVGVINGQNVSYKSWGGKTGEKGPLFQATRKEAYEADITFGTNNEFGFDYLRDNMVDSIKKKNQGNLNYAIIDEVDSVLIDEARTPLIISAPDTESAKLYQKFSSIVPDLQENKDYNVDPKMRSVYLSQKGITKIEKILNIDNLYVGDNIKYVHYLEQALKAQVLFTKDKDYIVKEGKVIIVDAFTGRLMPGRRYSEGLHQALEAKEGANIQQESKTLASITFQNYFRIYNKIAGMTGTAITSAEEFKKVYDLEVVEVPTNKPVIREDQPDVLYKTEEAKINAILKRVKDAYEKGRPVLIGTVAIEKSELLSKYLSSQGISHEVLNAKNHEREAKIIADAGQKGSVTIATNMAGRGTNIKLEKKVLDLGGLLIIATERHEARRIDDQLRGRSGRQGEPGTTQFYVSTEDELMRRFGFDKAGLMQTLLKQLPEDQPIENRMLTRALEKAQERVEGFNFDARKHVLEYDDVLNKQRMAIYRMRDGILNDYENEKNDKKEEKKLLLKRNLKSLKQYLEKLLSYHYVPNKGKVNIKEIKETIKAIYPFEKSFDNEIEKKSEEKDQEGMKKFLYKNIKEKLIEKRNLYIEKDKEEGDNKFNFLIKNLYLKNIDELWQKHLESMEYLRQGIKWQGYGQRDPLVEYKNRGYKMYKELESRIHGEVVNSIFKADVKDVKEIKMEQFLAKFANAMYKSGKNTPTMLGGKEEKSQTKSILKKPTVNGKTIGRNDPCPCGSGKKYKKCCGKNI